MLCEWNGMENSAIFSRAVFWVIKVDKMKVFCLYLLYFFWLRTKSRNTAESQNQEPSGAKLHSHRWNGCWNSATRHFGGKYMYFWHECNSCYFLCWRFLRFTFTTFTTNHLHNFLESTSNLVHFFLFIFSKDFGNILKWHSSHIYKMKQDLVHTAHITHAHASYICTIYIIHNYARNISILFHIFF